MDETDERSLPSLRDFRGSEPSEVVSLPHIQVFMPSGESGYGPVVTRIGSEQLIQGHVTK